MRLKTYITLVLGCSIWAINAQNIGINTSTPNAALDVKSTGSTSATYGVLVSNNANDTSLVVSDNGNVGIGTTLPVYSLDVQSSNPIAARFSGRVAGQNAVNSNEFITLQQAGTLSSSSGTSSATMWSSPSTSTMYFFNAVLYCRNLTEGGHTDWRIPFTEDFIDLFTNDAVTLPALNPNNIYWTRTVSQSSSTSNGAGRFRETINFNSGFTDMFISQYFTSTNLYVICIR